MNLQGTVEKQNAVKTQSHEFITAGFHLGELSTERAKPGAGNTEVLVLFRQATGWS